MNNKDTWKRASDKVDRQERQKEELLNFGSSMVWLVKWWFILTSISIFIFIMLLLWWWS